MLSPYVYSMVQVVPGRSVRSLVGDLERLFSGERPDITIECTGTESSIRHVVHSRPVHLMEEVENYSNILGYLKTSTTVKKPR